MVAAVFQLGSELSAQGVSLGKQYHEMPGSNQDLSGGQRLGSVLSLLHIQRGDQPFVVWGTGACPSLDRAELWFDPGVGLFLFSNFTSCRHQLLLAWACPPSPQLPVSHTKVHCCPIGPACPCYFLPLLWGSLLHLAHVWPPWFPPAALRFLLHFSSTPAPQGLRRHCSCR